MAEDTWYSNGNHNWGDDDAWNEQADGLGTALSDPDADAHVIIQGSDTITIDAAIGNSIKSLTVDAGSNLTGHASHPITISAEGTASFGTNGYAVRIHGGATLGTNVKLIVETQADTWATLNASGAALDSVTVNHASCNLILQGAATMGSLTITAGELDTHSNNYALTVTGAVSVTGILTGNASAIELGSLTIEDGGTYNATSGTTTITSETGGYAWTNNETDGTGFTHNKGLVHLDIGSSAGSTSIKENTFYNLKVDMHLATYDCALQDIDGNAITILNDLDIAKGEVEMMTASDSLTVHGLTNITADGKFNNNNTATGTITHHGLVTNLGTYKIKSGETYNLNGGIRQLGTLTVA